MLPSYPLDQIKQLFEKKSFRITETALQGAALMNFLDEEIMDCVNMLAAQKRLLIAFIVSPPILLGVYWLVQNGSRIVALALFLAMFVVDFVLLRPRASAASPGANRTVPSRAIWVVGGACFLGSLSLLVSGVETRQTWEIVLASFGILASGLGVVSFARR